MFKKTADSDKADERNRFECVLERDEDVDHMMAIKQVLPNKTWKCPPDIINLRWSAIILG
jgi:hypothetical protein